MRTMPSTNKQRHASAYRPATGFISLDSSAVSLIKRETKVPEEKKTGNFLPSRSMFNRQRDSSFSQRTIDGMKQAHHKLVPNFQVSPDEPHQGMKNKLRHVDSIPVMLQVHMFQQ